MRRWSRGFCLLYGLMGTGKTLTVDALAARLGRQRCHISFAHLNLAELETSLTEVTKGQLLHDERPHAPARVL